jgi:hypothetical protein
MNIKKKKGLRIEKARKNIMGIQWGLEKLKFMKIGKVFFMSEFLSCPLFG